MKAVRTVLVAAAVLATGLSASGQEGNGFPGGMFIFHVTGDQVVPPSGSEAVATCFGILENGNRTFSIGCTHNVAQVRSASIHRAEKGDVGPALFTFNSAVSPMRGQWSVTPELVTAMHDGELYVVIESQDFRNGEVRGQIVEGVSAFHFILDGSQVVPPNPIQNQGFCVGRVNGDETKLSLSCTHDVASASAAAIKAGLRGVNGPVLFDVNNPGNPIEEAFEISEDDLALIRSDGLYVDVSSSAYPDGQIRGQLIHHGECNSKEKSKASCKNGKLKSQVKKYAWLDPLDFCYDGENCVYSRTNGRGKAKMKWKNVPAGDHLVSTHYSCGETKYFMVRCD